MVLLGRIELPASPLPRVRSTTELQQHGSAARTRGVEAGAIGRTGAKVNLSLNVGPKFAKGCAMSDPNDKLSREERLAAKLRENLRRRKAQGREMRESEQDGVSNPPEGR